ncbi:HAD domain-containing protein [Cupriavidus sp. TMH.W2]|uniref:HAD domain-containing protein n=1 Tax=Cupriavidus sp. TMH.W2 TaxID=3434465 RepID=UPI003D7783E3
MLDCFTPTLFLNFDGTLHAGHALIAEDGQIILDSDRPLFEFAPLLVEMLRPHPSVQIVLTTPWLQTLPLERVIAHLPPELAKRVVGTIRNFRPSLSYLQSGIDRTYNIGSYACGKRLENWIALDDAVYGVFKFGGDPGKLMQHFILLDSERGISEEGAQQRFREWLERQ